MPLLNKIEKRSVIAFPQNTDVESIKQQYNKPATLSCKGLSINTACLRCTHPKCMRYLDEEISCDDFADFSYERNLNVCPVNAIQWDYDSELPRIDNEKCIKCGLCAVRCPVGAIYEKNSLMCIDEPSEGFTDVPINHANLESHKKFIRDVERINWQHHFKRESDQCLAQIYSEISKYDGRSMVPNVLVRNLIIALNHQCAISRSGDVYTRMDAVYSRNTPPFCKGAIEVEFSRDTLDASRSILDDIAVLHSRNNLDKSENTALVVCLSFPNRRQGYFQVIKDVNRVLNLKIQTISLGALLVLAWNGVEVNFLSKEFYVDFDNMSIRKAVETYVNRPLALSNGILGIMEPEK